MSSSQTMAAALVGHPPHEVAPERNSYDLCECQREDQYSSPLSSNSKREALSNSMFEHLCDSQTNSSAFPEEYKKQTDHERKSAASALLAQLLANQQATKSSEDATSHKGYGPGGTPANGCGQDEVGEQHEQSDNNGAECEVTTNATLEGVLGTGGGQSAMERDTFSEGLEGPPTGSRLNSDPMQIKLNVEPHLDQIFNDVTPITAPKTAQEALRQNELLTTAYLAGAFNSGPTPRMVGYPEVPVRPDPDQSQNGTDSIAGSEPRIQAFAKLEFDDGHFYVNTYSFILGRDVRAARAAYQRELQAKQAKTQGSSGGNTSHTQNRVKHEGSAILGSVVSDKGGIMGFDPDVPQHVPPHMSWKSSNSSFADQPSRPMLHMSSADYQQPNNAESAEVTKDYNALAMQSLHPANEPKRVDTLSLLPSPDACPIIPIHPPAPGDGGIVTHQGISRKHVKIAYNFDKNLFEMEVMGRNGAFMGADWLAPGQVRPLHSGDFIQIGGVRVRFLLPDVPIGETGAERIEDSYLERDGEVTAESGAEGDARPARDPQVIGNADADDSDNSREETNKVLGKATDFRKPETKFKVSIEAGQEVPNPPLRRRGPGRPPKDGIMSKRERAEIAREQKLAAKREANGGVTPPPSGRGKVGRPAKGGVDDHSVPKAEKRKYTKRKRPESTPADIAPQSVEGDGGDAEPGNEDILKVASAKKRKPSRSPSPNYPPESCYTPEELSKPPYNYAVLIFDALTESPHPMTLKQIYRALKLKYPYFRFKCETEGWTSSVRHNLNGNSHLFMHAERDGKGWSWKLVQGASVDKEKKRRPSPPPPSHSTNMGNKQSYMPPPPTGQSYSAPPSTSEHINTPHFAYPTLGNPKFSIGNQQTPHNSPYPMTTGPSFQLPGPLRTNLPPSFAPPTNSTYQSPYASAPPPPIPLTQPPQRPSDSQPFQSQSLHEDKKFSHPPGSNDSSGTQTSFSGAGEPQAITSDSQSSSAFVDSSSQNGDSFLTRANKAIDDFEAVLMEDYEDRDYISKVLRSARDRVLNGAKDSSFPGGEPKDESVIIDALKGIIGSLNEE